MVSRIKTVLILASVLMLGACKDVDLDEAFIGFIEVDGLRLESPVLTTGEFTDGKMILDIYQTATDTTGEISLRMVMPGLNKDSLRLNTVSTSVLVENGDVSSRNDGGYVNITGANVDGFEVDFDIIYSDDNESHELLSPYFTIPGPSFEVPGYLYRATTSGGAAVYLDMTSTYQGRDITLTSIALEQPAEIVISFDNNITVGSFDLAPLIPGSAVVSISYTNTSGTSSGTVSGGTILIDKVDVDNNLIIGRIDNASMTIGTSTITISTPFTAMLAN